MKNKVPVALALIGGFLLFQSSWVGSIGFIDDIAAYALLYFPTTADIVTMLLTVLIYIASLGGIAVISGGILIAMSRESTGKFVIGLGAGVGLHHRRRSDLLLAAAALRPEHDDPVSDRNAEYHGPDSRHRLLRPGDRSRPERGSQGRRRLSAASRHELRRAARHRLGSSDGRHR